jgi:hypothetical protein
MHQAEPIPALRSFLLAHNTATASPVGPGSHKFPYTRGGTIMNRWQSEWQSIDARIVGLRTTLSMMVSVSGMNGFNYEGMILALVRPIVVEVARSLRLFRDAYFSVLPSVAIPPLIRGLEKSPMTGIDLPSWQSVIVATVELVGLQAEVSAALVDPEAIGRQRAERAFEHLSRSIVVDDEYRERWTIAFSRGEVACERLGAVHLLLHGIWAFKSDSIGERTDLVLQERLAITRTVDSSEALVLTEWKLARESDEVPFKAEESQRQAAIYSGSSLAATELATIRYVVLVTRRRAVMPADVTDGRKAYRFVNLAVSPDTPSEAARRHGT